MHARVKVRGRVGGGLGGLGGWGRGGQRLMQGPSQG